MLVQPSVFEHRFQPQITVCIQVFRAVQGADPGPAKNPESEDTEHQKNANKE